MALKAKRACQWYSREVKLTKNIFDLPNDRMYPR
jgi:hypothetical protein